MPGELNGVEQAVSRTLRDNLEKIQRTADELHQAVNDMVAACASSRASNALPSMLRAQTSAASLSATLEVLSRFVTGALQMGSRSMFEPEAMRVPTMASPEPYAETPIAAPPPPPSRPAAAAPPPPLPPMPAIEQPPPLPARPKPEAFATQPPVPRPPAVPAPTPPPMPPPVVPPPVQPPPVAAVPQAPEPVPVLEPVIVKDPVPLSLQDIAPDFEIELPVEAQPPAAHKPSVEAAPVFNLDSLPPEEQELHRRAYRVAKVSMQDIRMLRPEDVRLGRQNKDLCVRLRDDIEKAHKEYDRRFQAIQSHPVDYFYDWLVEILAGGDPQVLGEYPYPSPVLRR
jgi:hypothetical protein